MPEWPGHLPRNAFKQALAKGERQVGLWSGLASPIATEILAGAGFDWIVIDGEHGPNDISTLLPQLHAMRGGTAEPVFRIPWNDMVIIKRALDVGVRTLLIPFVQNAEEAQRAVAATRYPPLGIRGVSVTPRANDYGRVHVQRPEKGQRGLGLLRAPPRGVCGVLGTPRAPTTTGVSRTIIRMRTL